MLAWIHEHFDTFLWAMFALVMLGALLRELLLRGSTKP